MDSDPFARNTNGYAMKSSTSPGPHSVGPIRTTLLYALAILASTLTPLANAGTVEGIAAFEAGNYEGAYAALKPEAERGDPEAQYYLGGMYWQGTGVTKDVDRARAWLQKAADQGHSGAMLELGYIYSNGLGVGINKKRAAQLYTAAARAGDAIAQRNLGLMYRNGEGVERDYEQAVQWFRKAVEQGDTVAAEKLGIAYYQGEGVAQDYKKAFHWFLQTAQEGRYWAQRRLAIMYDDGLGVETDLATAEHWYKKAIEHGDPGDKFLLAEMYRQTGFGSEAEALELFKAAAYQGHMFGQIHYGMFLMNGQGTEGEEVEDVSWTLEIEGYAWTLVAYERTGDPSAKNAVEVFKTGLSRDDIKRAKWRAKKILEAYSDQWDEPR